jgi:hemerythrin-like domain-containing protein
MAARKTKSSQSKAARTAKSQTRPLKRKTQQRKATGGRAAAGRGGTARSRAAADLARMAKKAGDISAERVVPGDALKMLEQDHREVEAFFEQYEKLEEDSEKLKLAAKICVALTVHTRLEEELIYPLGRKEIEETDLIDEAEVEHASAKQLIAEIARMSPGDDLFDAKVKVLGEYVKHHVKEEENELFPTMKEEADVDFDDIGKKMAARKTAMLTALR